MWDLELDWRFIHQQRGNYIYLIKIILTFKITITRVLYQMVFFFVIFFYSFPLNKGNILQLSPLVKRSHWQLCSEITIWDLHGLDWRHRGNSISAFTIILTFEITITGSMYKKSSFYQSIMLQLSSSWLDLKKVKLWLIEFPTAHRLMSLSLSGNVHSAYCQKRFPAIWLCVLGRVKGWVLYKII